jgi:hypothetical protein
MLRFRLCLIVNHKALHSSFATHDVLVNAEQYEKNVSPIIIAFQVRAQ